MSRNVLARRAGRTAFGLVLIAGAAAIAWATTNERDLLALLGIHHAGSLNAARLFELTWAAAVIAGVVVRGIVWLAAPAPRGDALLKPSLVAPAAGLALMLPLSLHLLVLHGDFDSWVRMSIRVVGLAHVVFAVLFAARAAGLARSATPGVSIAGIFVWSVVASFVPWPFIIPQALTAVTGLFILPVLFAFDAIAARERDALPRLPSAKVV